MDTFSPFADCVPIPVIALRPDTQGDTYAETQTVRLPWGIPGLYQHNEATWKDQVKERLARPLTEEYLARGHEYAAYINQCPQRRRDVQIQRQRTQHRHHYQPA